MLILIWSGLISGAASAESGASAGVKGSSADQGKTKHAFEELLVQGKYHFSDEAITTVEEDKVLDALIGLRKDFKDRIQESAAQR